MSLSKPSRKTLLKALVDCGRQFYERRWMWGTSGNLSVKLNQDPLEIAITPSGMSKGDLTTKDLIVVKDTPHPHPLPQGERGSKRFPSPLVGNLRANDPPIEARWSLQAVGREG